MTQPELLPSAFAAKGDVNEIPASSDGTAGLASFSLGFPVINQTPIAQGGIPPQRQDFNGIFKRITEFLMYVQSGGVFAYDASQTYDVGAFVISDNTYYKCIKANSPTDPHAPGDKTYWDLLIPADIVQEVTAAAGQLTVKKKDGSTKNYPIGRVTEVAEVGGVVTVTKEDGSKSTFKVVTSVNDDGGTGGNVSVSSGVIAGSVSNVNAWWVKLGGTIPLIIQGAYLIAGVGTDGGSRVTVSYPVSFSVPLAITNILVSSSGNYNNSGAGCDNIYSRSPSGFTFHGGSDLGGLSISYVAFGT